MSYSYQEGKDIVHFITEEDLHEYTEQSDRGEKDPRGENEQISVTEEVHDQYPGAVNEKGEINWDCPCLGGLGTEGPCVEEFRSAFSCWMFSSPGEEEGKEKGDECVDNFFSMSMCMQQNEEFYDDLNARNKAEADEARAKYEAEEREALAAAESQQKVLEAIAAEEDESELTDNNEAEVCPLATSSSEEDDLVATSSSDDTTLMTSSNTPQMTWSVSEPYKDDLAGISAPPTTVIVAAKTEEETEDVEEENVVTQE